MKSLRCRHFKQSLSEILFACTVLVFLPLSLLFGQVNRASGANITIDANAAFKGHINPLVFGHNVKFANNNLWDYTTDDLVQATVDNPNPPTPAEKATVKSRIRDLAPTILRFPGGTASDYYLWEDGLGFRIKELSGSNLVVDGETLFNPQTQFWGNPYVKNSQGFIAHSQTEPKGDAISLSSVSGSTLRVGGVDGTHPVGASVRPGARSGQSWWIDDCTWLNHYGIIEHLKLVNTLGAEALITVNYSTGLDSTGAVSTSTSLLAQKLKRAQALVAFVNGRTNDTRLLGTEGGRDWQTVGYWARKRAALGFPNPLDVRYWEVGNELCFESEPGYTTAAEYADTFIKFAKKMKEVDPKIRIGAVGLDLPDYWGKKDEDTKVPWNQTVFQYINAESEAAKNFIDFLVIHDYYPDPYNNMPWDFYFQEEENKNLAWRLALMAGAYQSLENLKTIRSRINNTWAPDRQNQIGLAVTEYGINPRYQKQSNDPPYIKAQLHSNLARAVHDADFVVGLIKESINKENPLRLIAASAWDLHSNNADAAIGPIWTGMTNVWGTRSTRPQYYALKILREKLTSLQMLDDSWDNKVHYPGTFITSEKVGNIPANLSVPKMDSLVAASNDRSRIILVVINRDLNAISVPISLGFTPQTAKFTKLASGNLLDHNELEDVVHLDGPYNIEPQYGFTHLFEANSLTVFEFIK